MLTTGYARNVFVLTDAVLKTDDTEMQKKLAYDVLQSYRFDPSKYQPNPSSFLVAST